MYPVRHLYFNVGKVKCISLLYSFFKFSLVAHFWILSISSISPNLNGHQPDWVCKFNMWIVDAPLIFKVIQKYVCLYTWWHPKNWRSFLYAGSTFVFRFGETCYMISPSCFYNGVLCCILLNIHLVWIETGYTVTRTHIDIHMWCGDALWTDWKHPDGIYSADRNIVFVRC